MSLSHKTGGASCGTPGPKIREMPPSRRLGPVIRTWADRHFPAPGSCAIHITPVMSLRAANPLRVGRKNQDRAPGAPRPRAGWHRQGRPPALTMVSFVRGRPALESRAEPALSPSKRCPQHARPRCPRHRRPSSRGKPLAMPPEPSVSSGRRGDRAISHPVVVRLPKCGIGPRRSCGSYATDTRKRRERKTGLGPSGQIRKRILLSEPLKP
jgi:hypothetical protein